MKPNWGPKVEDGVDGLVRSSVHEAVEAELEKMQDRKVVDIADAMRIERDWWMNRLEPLWSALDGRVGPDEAIDRLRVAFGLSAARLAELAASGQVWSARPPILTGNSGEEGP